MKKFALILMFIGGSFASAQRTKTAREVMGECKAPDPSPAALPVELMRFASCSAFMSGWMQGVSPSLTTTTRNGKVNLATLAYADSVVVWQVKHAFLLYMDIHPERETP